MRDIAGEHLLVPVGAAAARFNGLVTMNELGSFIFSNLREERTEEELLDLITEEYQVDRQVAYRDMVEFLQDLRRIGALVDGHD